MLKLLIPIADKFDFSDTDQELWHARQLRTVIDQKRRAFNQGWTAALEALEHPDVSVYTSDALTELRDMIEEV